MNISPILFWLLVDIKNGDNTIMHTYSTNKKSVHKVSGWRREPNKKRNMISYTCINIVDERHILFFCEKQSSKFFR